jgi:probable HAF family extracellular repeat protein
MAAKENACNWDLKPVTTKVWLTRILRVRAIANRGAAALLAVLVFAGSAAAQSYQIRSLGVLSGQTYSMATAINNSGTVVGRTDTRAFMYQNCTMTDLGTLGGNESEAWAISRQGTVVGWSRRSDGKKRAFSYAGGVMSDLGGSATLEESAFATSGWEIPAGIESASGGLGATAVYYYGGKTYSFPSYLLNPPSGYAYVQSVTGMNDLLQVTGYLTDSFGNAVGLVSASGFGAWTPIKGLPDRIPSVVPRAINQNSHVVGGAGWPYPHAFLSLDPNSTPLDLGTIGNLGSISVANAININDWVVGYSEYRTSGGLHAFLFNGSMIDLNTRLVNGTGWELVEATGINDSGQIVGWGFYNGQRTAFLLTPASRFTLFGSVSVCATRVLALP